MNFPLLACLLPLALLTAPAATQESASTQDATETNLESRLRANPLHAGRDFWRSSQDPDWSADGGPELWIELSNTGSGAGRSGTENERAFYADWCALVDSSFREQFAVPAQLTPATRSPAIVLFTNQRTYLRATRHLRDLDPYVGSGASFDPELEALLAWSQVDGSGAPEPRRRAVLRGWARHLIGDHGVPDLERALSPLVEVGLVDWLTAHNGTQYGPPEERPIEKGVLSAATRAVRLTVNGKPVPRLRQMIEGDPGVIERAIADGPSAELPRLWVHYLMTAGQRREHFVRWFALLQRGVDPGPAWDEAFDGAHDVDLERAFYQWLSELNVEANYGAKPLAAGDLEFLDRAPEDLVAPRARRPSAAAAAQPNEPEPAPYDGAALAPLRSPPGDGSWTGWSPGEIEAAHGLALIRARGGDLVGARELLLEAAAWSAAGAEATETAVRIARELERVDGMRALRDAYLEHLETEGGRIKLTVEGERVSLGLERIDRSGPEPVLHFEPNRYLKPSRHLEPNSAGGTELAVSDLPLHDLAMEMSTFVKRAEIKAGGTGWLRFYPYILEGDERWRRLLKTDQPGAAALAADAEAWIPAALRLGAAAEWLEALAGEPLPTEQVEARRVLDGLAALQPLLDLGLVDDRRGALRTLGSAALAQFYDRLALASLFRGSLTHEGDSVRLRYDFERAEELLDFAPQPDYLGGYRKSLFEIATETADVRVDGGELLVSGPMGLRHALHLSDPVSIKCSISVETAGEDDSNQFLAVFGICDDGAENMVQMGGPGYLFVHDSTEGYHEASYEGEPVQWEPFRPFELELRVDGGQASTRVDGELERELSAGPRTSGQTILFSHSDLLITIDSIELTGRLDPVELGRLEAEWIAGELALLGL